MRGSDSSQTPPPAPHVLTQRKRPSPRSTTSASTRTQNPANVPFACPAVACPRLSSSNPRSPQLSAMIKQQQGGPSEASRPAILRPFACEVRGLPFLAHLSFELRLVTDSLLVDRNARRCTPGRSIWTGTSRRSTGRRSFGSVRGGGRS